jgi:hypothetical protein
MNGIRYWVLGIGCWVFGVWYPVPGSSLCDGDAVRTLRDAAEWHSGGGDYVSCTGG